MLHCEGRRTDALKRSAKIRKKPLALAGTVCLALLLALVAVVILQGGSARAQAQSTTGIVRWDGDLQIVANRTAEVRPSTGQAARMFSMNMPNWRHDPYVDATYPQGEMERLAAELDRLTGNAEKGRIVWQMRQISLRRHPA